MTIYSVEYLDGRLLDFETDNFTVTGMFVEIVDRDGWTYLISKDQIRSIAYRTKED